VPQIDAIGDLTQPAQDLAAKEPAHHPAGPQHERQQQKERRSAVQIVLDCPFPGADCSQVAGPGNRKRRHPPQQTADCPTRTGGSCPMVERARPAASFIRRRSGYCKQHAEREPVQIIRQPQNSSGEVPTDRVGDQIAG
jgi:hypothetical protein